MEASPSDSVMKMKEPELKEKGEDNQEFELEPKKSGVLNVVIAGIALFSDGYNAEISMW